MDCSFRSPAGVVVIRFGSLFEPLNLNLERLPEKPRNVNNKKAKEGTFRFFWTCRGGVAEGERS